MSTPDGWLTTAEAAALLGISQRGVQKAAERHKWERRTLHGRMILVRRADVERYAEQRQQRKGKE